MSRSMMIGATSLSGGGGGGVSGVNTLHLNDGILTQRAEVSSAVSLDVTNITASVYFLVRQFSGTMTVFSKYQDGLERSWSMNIDPITRNLSADIYVGGTLFTATAVDVLTVDTWYQGAFSYDGSDLKLYLDADLKDTVEVSNVKISGDLPTNGSFDTDLGDWSFSVASTGTWDNGAAYFFNVSGTNTSLQQSSVTESGKYYQVTVEIKDYVQGNCGVSAATDYPFNITGDGTYATIFLSNSSTFKIKRIGGAYDFKVDNITVFELDASTLVDEIDISTADVRIGARGDTLNENPFIGDAALAIIYSADVLQAGITELFTPKDPSLYTQTNMVMGLPLNFGSATPAADTSGNGNDATLINSPDYTGVKLAIEQGEVIPTLQAALHVVGDSGLVDISPNAHPLTNNGSTINIADVDVNGHDTFEFGGTNQWFETTSAISKPTDYTIMSVIKKDVGNASGLFGAGTSEDTAWGAARRYYWFANDVVAYHSDTALDFKRTGTTAQVNMATSFVVLHISYTAGDGLSKIYVNGSIVSVEGRGSGGDPLENTGVDTKYRFGGVAFDSTELDGRIAEHKVFTSVLSDSEILDEANELITKYGL